MKSRSGRAMGLLLGTVLMGLAARPAQARNITFNGSALTPKHEAQLEMLEQYYRVRLPEGRYWYDNRSGAFGMWGGPAAGVIPAGLGFGGAMPANASGGGTGMFVNGRELHPIDVARLGGPPVRARFWLDANGNYGLEGGPMLGNLNAQAQPVDKKSVFAPGEIGRGGMVVNPCGVSTSTGSWGGC